MNVTTTYEQNVDESYRGLKAGMRSRRRLWWTCCTVVLIGGIGEIALGQTLFGAAAVTFGVLFSLQFTLRAKRSIAKAQVRAPGPMEVDFTEDKAVFRKPGSTSEVAWLRFAKLAETSEFFLLYLTKRMVVPVPKRAFKPAEAAEVSAFLSAMPNYTG
ncbi:YcxB family protein [Streptomyces sp. FXJ1.172]|uniref:YcxB family protein n=1 Tax=Streptomyces sp. FXJ1.172 TaxID=710705 RepID=UPI0007D01EF9|nr:YcxB family protein [Streptomyces sp. FXJ1.172]WEP00006.1 YcxB family protein [Streptomyces sp. FXJ1.172]